MLSKSCKTFNISYDVIPNTVLLHFSFLAFSVVLRADLFNHMAVEHSFNVGQPDNIGIFTLSTLIYKLRYTYSFVAFYIEILFRGTTNNDNAH